MKSSSRAEALPPVQSGGIQQCLPLPSLHANFVTAVEILGNGLLAIKSPIVRKMREEPGPTSLQPLFRLAYALIFLLVVRRDDSAQNWNDARLARMLADLLETGAFRDNFAGMRDEIPALSVSGALAASVEALLRDGTELRNLGSPELGALHEALLETRPVIGANDFKLQSMACRTRKTSGSYYTPKALVDCLLDSALDPLVERCLKAENPQQALLDLKICDPACGCGNFLIAAARRIAMQLAKLRGPAPENATRAMREVMGRCIYGVDINPLTVLVCKLCLWLEAREKRIPDYHVACGNFLLGVNRKVIYEGTGATWNNGGPCADFAELPRDGSLGSKGSVGAGCNGDISGGVNLISLYDFENRERIFPDVDCRMKFCLLTAAAKGENSLQSGFNACLLDASTKFGSGGNGLPALASEKKLYAPDKLRTFYDLWTAAFLEDPAENRRITRQIIAEYATTGELDAEIAKRAERLARDFRFFHLEVMFPEAAGGFDVVLSNPPWEHNEIRDKEWFAARGRPDIARLAGAARKKAIAGLAHESPGLFAQYRRARSESGAMRRFFAASYPLCGKGKINLYAVFVEAMLNSLNMGGILGCIVPSGLATDENTRFLFRDLVDSGNIANLHDFENKNIFPDVHSSYKFCLLTASRTKRRESARYAFFLHSTCELKEPGRCVELCAEDIALLNPNTRTCPVFRKAKDAELAKAVYRRLPILARCDEAGKVVANPWEISFSQGMFNMTTASGLFRTERDLNQDGWILDGNLFVKDGKRFLPLYEAKMIHHFNHRFAGCVAGDEPRFRESGLNELENPRHVALPRYWLAEENVKKFRGGWLMGFRNVCRATDERTIVGGAFPFAAVGNSLPIWSSRVPEAAYFPAMLSSFACDYFARLKIGGMNFNFYLARQMAVLPPEVFRRPTPWDKSISFADWLRPRILELTFTSLDMRPWAADLGYYGEPFAWDEERRFQLRAELDAAFFHLYLPAGPAGTWLGCEKESEAHHRVLVAAFPTPADAVAYIMESFVIRKRKDEQKHGQYRTKERILDIYHNMLKKLKGT